MLQRDSCAMVDPVPKLRRATTITKALLGRQPEVSVLFPFFYFYFSFSFSFLGRLCWFCARASSMARERNPDRRPQFSCFVSKKKIEKNK